MEPWTVRVAMWSARHRWPVFGLIDATIVRSVLLPASMQLLGDWNWWLPRFLGWLPHITIEGEALELAEPEA